MGDAIIRVDNLVKIYNGSIKAVDGVTFSVQEGEVFGFLGPNGAGKTTTISILTTLLKPTGGSANVMGLDVIQDATKVRKLIGLVPQELTVDDDLTGKENMILQADLYNVPRKDAAERIEELLRLVKLEDAADRMVKTYSGGMRKRLELAEGLIHRPKVLFLDEPTLGLDVQTRAVMWDYIRELKRKHSMTVFMTTHYLEEADSLCDRIGIIDYGRIMALDTPDTLKRSLGGDVLQIRVEGDGDHSGALRAVEGVLDVKKEGLEYRIKVLKGETAMADVLKSLISAKAVVKSVYLERPNMDQVFLEYTGRSLRDAEQSGPPDKYQARRGPPMFRRRR
mgnify:CR=1 FL=1